jgi:MFS family permease
VTTHASTLPDRDPIVDFDSRYSWMRLGVCVLLSTIGSVGIWSVVVVLPAVQSEFVVSRADASLPFTLTTIGFAFGGILMGRLSDRFGIFLPVAGAALSLGCGYIASGLATTLWQFALAHALLIGLLGCSATFGPLMSDISHWFVRRRGFALASCASGNYLAGVVWPPIVQHFVSTQGWRLTHIGIGLFCAAAMLPLALALRRRLLANGHALASRGPASAPRELGLRPNTLQVLLAIAGIACCVPMAMPQVHIVAYCGDLGYGIARGAEMLSLMLGFGIVSRIASGWIADRIGGAATLLLGSALQTVALFLYLVFDGPVSLYLISALFGLFQGGIVPSYAIIVREYFPPRETATRVGIVLMASLFGMALGGWMSGAIFDYAGSYRAAFASGIAWNLINVAIVLRLIMRPGRRIVHA